MYTDQTGMIDIGQPLYRGQMITTGVETTILIYESNRFYG
jgi:hypothetical protein